MGIISYKNLRNCFHCLFVAAAMAACTAFEQDMPCSDDIVNEYPVLLNVSDPQTKISVDGNVITWEETDRVQLTAITDGIEVSDTIGTSILNWFGMIDSDPSKASFSGFVTLRSEPKSCYFTHPVGEAMNVDALSGEVIVNYTAQNGTHSPFLYGKTAYDPEGMTTAMNHVGAVLELTVETEGVTKISFVGNKLENLSPILINPDDETIGYPTEAVKQITVNVQKDGKTYLFVPPVCLERGFSLICSDDDGTNYFIKSYSDGSTGGYDLSVVRGKKIPITISGEFEQFAITATDLQIVHSKNTNDLLTGTTATFKMSKSGTPHKIIEEWGATLINEDGETVRTFSSDQITSDQIDVTMSSADGYILLEEGKYTLTPYYMMYGQKITLTSQVKTIVVADPGIVIEINGTTSYDKYLANDISGANSHANTLLSGLSISTNVVSDIIEITGVSLVGDDDSSIDVKYYSTTERESRTYIQYGDKTCTKYQSYLMTASLEVGGISVSASRTFHITGLPYEVNFTSGNPIQWIPAWTFCTNVKYNKTVYYTGDGSVRSPSYYIPKGKSINVLTSVDACLSATIKDNRRMYIKSCSSTESGTDFNCAYADLHYKLSHGSDSYKDCNSTITLTPENPALLYSKKKPGAYTTSFYRVKINYSN